jgi:hypothetical protein
MTTFTSRQEARLARISYQLLSASLSKINTVRHAEAVTKFHGRLKEKDKKDTLLQRSHFHTLINCYSMLINSTQKNDEEEL